MSTAKALSAQELEFVRRASKEIVCCLLPDELTFFDSFWGVLIERLLDRGAEPEETAEALALAACTAEGIGLGRRWAPDTDIWEDTVVAVFRRSLQRARQTGSWSLREIGEIVAAENLRQPCHLPDSILRMAIHFISEYAGLMIHPDPQILESLERARNQLPHAVCFYVFHDGQDQFYPGEVPLAVLQKRESIMFWLDWVNRDFRSRNQRRESQGLGPQAEQMLRFLCWKQNAGRTISFNELYSRVWGKDFPDLKRMEASIQVEVSKLNAFALKGLEGHSTNYKFRHMGRGSRQYTISEDLHQECCIIRSGSLPT